MSSQLQYSVYLDGSSKAAANTASKPKYDPYVGQNAQKTPSQSSTYSRNTYSRSTNSGYSRGGDACSSRLDHMTRSRNALIIVAVVFLIAFLVVLFFLLANLNKFELPQATKTIATLQVVSNLPNTPYNPALDDPNNYAFSLLNVTVCGYIVDAAKSVSTVVSCDTQTFEDNSGKVKATNQLKVKIDGKTETERFTDVSGAIVAAAATNTKWDVTNTDVTMVATAFATIKSPIMQWPLLLCSCFLLRALI